MSDHINYSKSVHCSMTEDLLVDAIESLEYLGYCTQCGSEHDRIEPDTSKEKCEECGTPTLYGAEQLIIMGRFHACDSGDRSTVGVIS